MRFSYNHISFMMLVFLVGCIPEEEKAQSIIQEIEYYNFIRYDQNKIQVSTDSAEYNNLFESFNRLILKGEGQINIVHIGDSHLQADMLSGQIRKRLQTFFYGGIGGRGFVFPYSVAGTNNAVNIKVNYTGYWSSCKNIEPDHGCELGLSGINVMTVDPEASITIKLAEWQNPKYDFTKIKIFHSISDSSYIVDIENYTGCKEVIVNDTLGYTLFLLDDPIDSLCLTLLKTVPSQNSFILHGISLESDDQGVLYHAIGVNGAKANSYLKCNLFAQHLKALEPDWIIISLGANDIYTKNFDQTAFALNMNRLVRLVRQAAPGVPILLTTPGDNFYANLTNPNTIIAQEAIFKVAKLQTCSVWDFYTIMGGFNSVNEWFKYGLSAKDRLHFSKDGYVLQGDLLFNAFLEVYDEYIERQNNNVTETKLK